jgi:RNA polymerase sigma factor (sigma-70 family)
MSRNPTARRDAEPDPRQGGKWLEDAFACYQPELLGALFCLLGNAEDAKDAIQETFIKCWKHRDELPEIGNRRAWIFRIALNTGRDLRGAAWRRHRRPLAEGEDVVPATDVTPETIAADREEVAILRRAILQLRPEEQEVFLLRQNGRMTYEQIAEATNIPLGTVKTRMRLALVKLRESIEGKV